MPSNYIIGKITISPENVMFDYSGFYKVLHKTLSDKGYFIEEKKYSHKPQNKKKNVDFYWKCTREVDDYSQYKIEVDARFTNLETMHVLKKDKKIKMNKGDGKIIIRATLITDYDSKWEENPIINFFKVIFENIFEKSSLKNYLKDLKNEFYEIENEIKSYFNIQRMM